MKIGDVLVHGTNLPLRDWRQSYSVRQDRIKREGSPYFTWQVPVTAPAAVSTIVSDQQFPLSRKYSPLDWLEIANNDVVNLTLTLNGAGGDTFPVPAGTIRTIKGKGLRTIAVTNNDAVANTTLNLITVTVRRQPKTIDKWAQENG